MKKQIQAVFYNIMWTNENMLRLYICIVNKQIGMSMDI